MNKTWISAGLGLWLAAAGAMGQATNQATRIKGFRVPLYDEKGNLSSQIFGETANMLPDGMVEITDLMMEFYDDKDLGQETREAKMRVTSPQCFFHRERQMAASESSVRIAGDNMVVTGTGFLWNNDDQKLVIMTNSKVILKNASRTMNEGVAE